MTGHAARLNPVFRASFTVLHVFPPGPVNKVVVLSEPNGSRRKQDEDTNAPCSGRGRSEGKGANATRLSVAQLAPIGLVWARAFGGCVSTGLWNCSGRRDGATGGPGAEMIVPIALGSSAGMQARPADLLCARESGSSRMELVQGHAVRTSLRSRRRTLCGCITAQR